MSGVWEGHTQLTSSGLRLDSEPGASIPRMERGRVSGATLTFDVTEDDGERLQAVFTR